MDFCCWVAGQDNLELVKGLNKKNSALSAQMRNFKDKITLIKELKDTVDLLVRSTSATNMFAIGLLTSGKLSSFA